MSTWATPSDVLSITGASATQAEVDVAEETLLPWINRGPSASASMSARDLFWLKRAVAWQSVWLPDQPGYFSRTTSSSWSQDGESVTHRSAAEEMLAPLAARALRNTTWKGSKTTRILPVGTPVGTTYAQDFTLESSDERHGWEPL